MNSRHIMELIEADGWFLVRIRGSHHPTKPGLVTIPHPRKDLLPRTAASILEQAGLK